MSIKTIIERDIPINVTDTWVDILKIPGPREPVSAGLNLICASDPISAGNDATLDYRERYSIDIFLILDEPVSCGNAATNGLVFH